MSFLSKLSHPRDGKRTRVLMSGTLFNASGTHKVRIRDISCQGAHIASPEEMEVDRDVLLKRDAIFVAGRIAWVTPGEAGIRFYRELSPDEIEASLPAELLRGR